MSETVVAVVGAGVTGLACADALAPRARAVVVDRIPVVGGVLGWDHPTSVELAAQATAAGARLHLGETAIRWDGDTLMVVGQDGVRRIQAAALVIAAGSRPLGRAELGLTGPRPAGILPATVACHLSETGLLIGRRPAVIGGGDWAARALERLLHAGADTIEVIAPDGVLRPLPELGCDHASPRTDHPWPSRACTGSARCWSRAASGSTAMRSCSPTRWRRCETWTAPCGTARAPCTRSPAETPRPSSGRAPPAGAPPPRRWS